MSYKLTAERIPYSSVVGGGVKLKDLSGRARFILNVIGTTEGVTKNEHQDITKYLQDVINRSDIPLYVRERGPEEESP